MGNPLKKGCLQIYRCHHKAGTHQADCKELAAMKADDVVASCRLHRTKKLHVNTPHRPGFLKSFPGGQSAAEFSSNPDQTPLPVIL